MVHTSGWIHGIFKVLPKTWRQARTMNFGVIHQTSWFYHEIYGNPAWWLHGKLLVTLKFKVDFKVGKALVHGYTTNFMASCFTMGDSMLVVKHADWLVGWLVMSLVVYEYSCHPVIIIVHYTMFWFSLTAGPKPIHCIVWYPSLPYLVMALAVAIRRSGHRRIKTGSTTITWLQRSMVIGYLNFALVTK